MKKVVIIHRRAEKELATFPESIEDDFRGFIKILKEVGVLGFPEARKVAHNLFEIRVRQKESYRGFYAYIDNEATALLHFFKKKTQKIPIRHMKTALKRLQEYE